MLRVLCRMEDAGKAANVGGSVDCEYKTFDVDLPEVEEYIRPQPDLTYRYVEVIGVEVLPSPPTNPSRPDATGFSL